MTSPPIGTDEELIGYWGPDVDGDWIVSMLGAGLSFAVADEQTAKAIVEAVQSRISEVERLRSALRKIAEHPSATCPQRREFAADALTALSQHGKV